MPRTLGARLYAVSTDPAKLLKAVAQQVVRLRRDRGWTQEQLAERADVSSRYLQRIERGRENLTLTTLAKIADALRIRVAELFATKPKRRASPSRRRP